MPAPFTQFPIPTAFLSEITDPPRAVRLWSGGCKHNLGGVAWDLTSAAPQSAVFSLNSDLSNPVYESATVTPAGTDGISYDPYTASMRVETYYPCIHYTTPTLPAATRIYYAPKINGVIQPESDGTYRSFMMLSAPGSPASHRIVFLSCVNPISNSNLSVAQWASRVGRSIAALNPKPVMLVFLGDIDYPDTADDDVRLQRARNTRTIRDNPDFDELFKTISVEYIFDDHDSAGNDQDLSTTYTNKSTYENILKNSRQAIRETMALRPTVQDGLGGFPIAQNILSRVWDIGLVRYYLPDMRSLARRGIAIPTTLGRGLGSGDYWNQRDWFVNTFIPGCAADNIEQAIFFCSRTWTGGPFAGMTDAFPAEKAFLCDAIQAAPTPFGVCSGDAHMSFPDDGTNTGDASTDGLGRFWQLDSSPAHNSGVAALAGPSSWNGSELRVINNSSQFCVYDVTHTAVGNLSWQALFMGAPYDPSTFAATLLIPVSSADAGRVVSVAVSGYVQVTDPRVAVFKSWFGPFGGIDVDWSTSDGSSGTLNIGPNSGVGYIDLPAQLAGHVTTVTLTAVGSGATLGNAVMTATYIDAIAETLTLLSRMTVQPNGTRVGVIDTLMRVLVASTAWPKLVGFKNFLAHDEQAAGLNWKDPFTYASVANYSPTFTIDRGYAGNGTSSYVDSTFTAQLVTTTFAVNSCHIGFWSGSSAQNAAADFGNSNITMIVRNLANGITHRSNSASAVTTAAISLDGSGDFVMSRSGANSFKGFRNGVEIVSNTGNPSAAFSSETLWECGGRNINSGQTFTNRPSYFFSWGGDLTAAEILDIYNARDAFRVAVGAP